MQDLSGKVVIEQHAHQLFALAGAVHVAVIVGSHVQQGLARYRHALRGMLQTRMNLECAVTDEMVDIALRIKPHDLCLVPERREELTTEGGLDVLRYFDSVKSACERCADAGIRVSLFIDSDEKQIDAAVRTGAPVIELHTGKYADTDSVPAHKFELERIRHAAEYAHARGLQVNAGHGLNYHNVRPIVAIPNIAELNIGHAIISEAVFIGLEQAVKNMKALLVQNS